MPSLQKSPPWHRAHAACAVTAAMITSVFAGTRTPYSIPMPYAPLPEYPVEARVKHWTGTGRFLIKADRDTGLVDGVTTIRSTGHSILDKAAEKALYRWKFPPGVEGMIIPVTFTTKGAQISHGAGHTPSGRASK